MLVRHPRAGGMGRQDRVDKSAWARRRFACVTAVLIGLLGLVAYPVAADPLGLGTTAVGAAYDAREGGLYNLLYGDPKQRHHMPSRESQDLVGGYYADCGPAIRMDPEDHERTASYGSGSKLDGTTKNDGSPGRVDVEGYRLKQANLIRAGRFREAIDMDIQNLKNLGLYDKYESAIEGMLEEYERVKDSIQSLSGKACTPTPPPGSSPPPDPDPDPDPAPAPAPGAPAPAPGAPAPAPEPGAGRGGGVSGGVGGQHEDGSEC